MLNLLKSSFVKEVGLYSTLNLPVGVLELLVSADL